MKISGGKIFLILGALLCSGFFFAQKVSAEASVAISEICWAGSAASANAEWLELYNGSGAEISLAGWTVNAADGQPKITLSGAIPAGGYFLLERTSDESVPGIAADQVYAGALGNSGEVLELKDGAGNLVDKIDASSGWPAGDNSTKQTLERAAGGSWQSSAAAGGTPKAPNSGSAPSGDGRAEEPAPENLPGSGYRWGDVLINEFQSDAGAGEDEWVELYNRNGGGLSLDGWIISDATGAETILSGGFGPETDYRLFIVEKLKGALNNDGDAILLYSPDRNLIDRVVYGRFGSSSLAAPAPGKGQSAALKKDGLKTGDLKNDYAITTEPTKARPNIIAAPEENGQASSAASEPSGGISITEIFPNPSGSDRTGEFVEFYNSSDKEADLSGYKLENSDGRVFIFGRFGQVARTIKAKEYFSLFRGESGLVLDNDGGAIKLFAPGKARASQVLEYEAAAEGQAYINVENADLSSSSTKDYFKNSLTDERWLWTQAPTPAAPNLVKVANRPPRIEFSFPEKIVAGLPALFDASDSVDADGQPLSFAWDFSDGIKLGLETPAHAFLKAGDYKVRLVASDGQSETIAEKIIKVLDASGQPAPSVKTAGARISSTAVKAPANSEPIYLGAAYAPAASTTEAIPLAEVFSLPAGRPVKTSGTVLVAPGVFGLQYFYITDSASGQALKIYNYKKYFPALAAGDLIEASGETTPDGASRYLKTKAAADIIVLGRGEMAAPEPLGARPLFESDLGKFVEAEGEVLEKTGAKIYLSAGQEKIAVYLKAGAGIDIAKIKIGGRLKASGLVLKQSGLLAILPRGESDLEFTPAEAAEGEVLGASTTAPVQDWILPARDSRGEIFIYLFIVALAAALVLGGLLLKEYPEKKKID